MSEPTGQFQTTSVILPGRQTRPDQLDWNPHPAFPGVWMKHLILGEDSGGQLSCHLVRVENGCEIGRHVHEGSLEVHEVLEGRGICRMEDREQDYEPGVCMLIPAGVVHSVMAREGEMILMARFAPALV